MLRLISIVLLAVLGCPFVSPLVPSMRAAGAEVPVCCRKAGKHHCMMSLAKPTDSARQGTRLRAPEERCPFFPRAISPSHQQVLSLASPASIFALLNSHAAGIAQTESKWRIARDRSRQKRGPPSLLG